MEKAQFKTTINAPREKVWKVLWDDATYREWTQVFNPGSGGRVETDNWKKGSKVLFLDGKGSGMVSRVVDNVPNELMLFEHVGEVQNGVEDLESDRVQQWAGSREDYHLKTVNGQTELMVEMDLADEYADMFKDMFPKALTKVKEIAERS